MNKTSSKKKAVKEPQVMLYPGKVFEMKDDAKYLLIFPATDHGDLASLNKILGKFFGDKKVLALFVNDVNDVKIAELLEADSDDDADSVIL